MSSNPETISEKVGNILVELRGIAGLLPGGKLTYEQVKRVIDLLAEMRKSRKIRLHIIDPKSPNYIGDDRLFGEIDPWGFVMKLGYHIETGRWFESEDLYGENGAEIRKIMKKVDEILPLHIAYGYTFFEDFCKWTDPKRAAREWWIFKS